jgi:L-malate glycosyltransferase
MPENNRLPHILHLHSSFNPGGKEVRCVQLVNGFGTGVRHSIVSGMVGAMGAAVAISPEIAVDLAPEFPALQGRPMPGRLLKMARAMADYDLILTYNFGAMDAVMAHMLFSGYLNLPPLIHHEDGFNADEAVKLKPARNVYRRIALARVAGLVVPSRRLEGIARSVWGQPKSRVHRIVNGIKTADYLERPKADALPRVIKRDGEKWLGTLAGLKPVKNLTLMVRAFAALPEEWQLVIVGEGPDREAIRDEALHIGVAHRVHLPGFVAQPAKVVGLFDLYALSSDSEQFPISVVEAMAAGLAVVSTDVGDVRAMLAAENAAFLASVGDEARLGAAMLALADDGDLRVRVGAANRARAQVEYDEAAMLDAYRRLYGGVMARKLG